MIIFSLWLSAISICSSGYLMVQIQRSRKRIETPEADFPNWR
jgi:hypothetical protein